jgi:hypothetical protein
MYKFILYILSLLTGFWAITAFIEILMKEGGIISMLLSGSGIVAFMIFVILPAALSYVFFKIARKEQKRIIVENSVVEKKIDHHIDMVFKIVLGITVLAYISFFTNDIHKKLNYESDLFPLVAGIIIVGTLSTVVLGFLSMSNK